jgi:Tol biopolymer transport system component
VPRDDGSLESTLVLVDVKRGEETPLTSAVRAGTGLTYRRPCGWSPDGQFVAAAYRDAQGRSELSLLPLSAAPRSEAQAKVLTESPSRDLALTCQGNVVHSSGWLAFVGVRRTVSQTTATIYVMNIRGGPWVQITDGTDWAHFPEWSRDGRTLYFISVRNGVYNIWAAGFDPSTAKRVGRPYRVTRFDGTVEEFAYVCCEPQIGVTEKALILPVTRPEASVWMIEVAK